MAWSLAVSWPYEAPDIARMMRNEPIERRLGASRRIVGRGTSSLERKMQLRAGERLLALDLGLGDRLEALKRNLFLRLLTIKDCFLDRLAALQLRFVLR